MFLKHGTICSGETILGPLGVRSQHCLTEAGIPTTITVTMHWVARREAVGSSNTNRASEHHLCESLGGFGIEREAGSKDFLGDGRRLRGSGI